jgi:hypothetical protein
MIGLIRSLRLQGEVAEYDQNKTSLAVGRRIRDVFLIQETDIERESHSRIAFFAFQVASPPCTFRLGLA